MPRAQNNRECGKDIGEFLTTRPGAHAFVAAAAEQSREQQGLGAANPTLHEFGMCMSMFWVLIVAGQPHTAGMLGRLAFRPCVSLSFPYWGLLFHSREISTWFGILNK